MEATERSCDCSRTTKERERQDRTQSVPLTPPEVGTLVMLSIPKLGREADACSGDCFFLLPLLFLLTHLLLSFLLLSPFFLSKPIMFASLYNNAAKIQKIKKNEIIQEQKSTRCNYNLYTILYCFSQPYIACHSSRVVGVHVYSCAHGCVKDGCLLQSLSTLVSEIGSHAETEAHQFSQAGEPQICLSLSHQCQDYRHTYFCVLLEQHFEITNGTYYI